MLRKKLPVTIIAILILLFTLGLMQSKVNATGNSSFSESAGLPQIGESDNPVAIYFFYGEGCPHCASAKPVLQDFADSNPQIVFSEFEVYRDQKNQEIFFTMASVYGFEPKYVPTIMVADRYWEGFNETIQLEIFETVNTCLQAVCTDLGADVLKAFTTPEPSPTITASSTPVPKTPTKTMTEIPSLVPTLTQETTPEPEPGIRVPLLGTIDLSGRSLLISTILIAFIDGFNPCSIWVLTMLLTITLRTGSRKKILIIGFVFLFVTSLIYALFIAGLFTFLTFISFMGWIRVLVALVSLFFGLVNLKDYFWYKEGLSFTIDDKAKPGLYKRMRRVLNAGNSFWGLVGGTIVLSAGVSLVEFSCTAGFPVLWTNMLTSQNVNTISFIGLLLVYMLVYQLIALGIFLAAVFTLKSGRIEEKHGRILKLVGGVLMITLAIIIVVNPSLMNSLRSSLIIFAIAFGVSFLILLIHRHIIPKLKHEI